MRNGEEECEFFIHCCFSFVQDWLFEANPFLPHVKRTLSSDSSLRPDGDVLISDVNPEYLKIPPCPKCSGVLKPNVTFFGESIPKTRTQLTYDLVDNCDAVFVSRLLP